MQTCSPIDDSGIGALQDEHLTVGRATDSRSSANLGASSDIAARHQAVDKASS